MMNFSVGFKFSEMTTVSDCERIILVSRRMSVVSVSTLVLHLQNVLYCTICSVIWKLLRVTYFLFLFFSIFFVKNTACLWSFLALCEYMLQVLFLCV